MGLPRYQGWISFVCTHSFNPFFPHSHSHVVRLGAVPSNITGCPWLNHSDICRTSSSCYYIPSSYSVIWYHGLYELYSFDDKVTLSSTEVSFHVEEGRLLSQNIMVLDRKRQGHKTKTILPFFSSKLGLSDWTRKMQYAQLILSIR